MAVARRALALLFACAAREAVGTACFLDLQENSTALKAAIIEGLTTCLKTECEDVTATHLFNASGGNRMLLALTDPCTNALTKDIKCSTKWMDVLVLGYSVKAFIPPTMWNKTWGEVCPSTCACCGTGDCTVDLGSSCDTETGGTCSLLSCAASRGGTRCVGGVCKCASGYCAKGGICFPSSKASCVADTGGTCSVTGCSRSRGDTKCKAGTCLCKTGGCAWKGACFPVTDTGGSCSALSCDVSRGPTTCHRGRCLCKENYVAVAGMCVAL
mmetsp:Transcript_49877/g.161369  ORF Transcript_49877/g.161369 Transcript_49877/m.161369 type:complete len:271 (+) Transcript_49877:145-957(+)